MLPPSYLSARKFRPLTEDECKVFIALTQLPDCVVPSTELAARLEEMFGERLANSFHVAVMAKRLSVMRPDLMISPVVLLLCALLSDRVGVAVSWAYTMVDYQRMRDAPMMFNDWVDMFPTGVPPEEEMERIWNAQKSERGGNLIDAREAWAAKHTTLS